MPSNPVQIVLNSRNFVAFVEPNRGGSEREFFEGRNQEFVKHKATLTRQVSGLAAQLITSAVSEVGVAKVKMRPGALAKTHVPTIRLFRPDLCPTLGGGNLGELFVEITPKSLDAVARQISEAEDVVSYKLDPRTKKQRANPSTLRSEVGAVERITLLSGEDKRSFSAATALQFFARFEAAPAYLVDLFYFPNSRAELGQLSIVRRRLVESFVADLQNAFGGNGTAFRSGSLSKYGCPVIVLSLTKGAPAEITLESILSKGVGRTGSSEYDIDGTRHRKLLEFLDNHPLVRRVNLSPLITHSRVEVASGGSPIMLPTPDAALTYPKIAIVDGGLHTMLGDWVVGRSELLADSHRDLDHGTFIAGLVIGGRTAGNPASVVREIDGCQVYDIALIPDQARATLFNSYYPQGIDGFLTELRSEVNEAKARGFRIFNLSVNSTDSVQSGEYSPFAAGLDALARELDVIFVISAGNVLSDPRPPWPSKAGEALALLAGRPSIDPLLQPAESVTALAVGAINPPGLPPHIEGAPTCYTRRGPGMRVGGKPDLAHFGGCGDGSAANGYGILSISTDATVVSEQGTSFATPLVAKTLATLDLQIEGHVPRETLLALMIHNARVPDILNDKQLAAVARQFVGFGIPSSAGDMLQTSDNTITLIFANRLGYRQQLQFPFTWPACLYDSKNNRCSGEVRLTLVYSPPIDRGHGAEFLRVNLDAHLRQAKPDGIHWQGQLVPSYLPPPFGGHEEKDLIEHGLKWWPIKVYNQKWSRFVGGPSQWMLAIDSITRPNQPFPSEGIAFAAILTISDSLGGARPVFTDLKQWLQAHNVQCHDIRTASRIRPRV